MTPVRATVIAILALTLMPVAAVEHPALYLNRNEISAIRERYRAGQEPWRTAGSHVLAAAREALGKGPYILPSGYGQVWLAGSSQAKVEDRYGYRYDHHRRVAREFGNYLVNVAMAWHLTGEQRYVDWAKRNIDSWFLDPSTAMKPIGATVGMNASFPIVLYGVDLIWPALDDARRDRLDDWFRRFHASVAAKPDGGGVGSDHNRADWWVLMTTVSGIMAGRTDRVQLAYEHLSRRRVSADGKFAVGGDSAESRANYTYFALAALSASAELCRHYGLDAYSLGQIDGRSKLERIWDFLSPCAYSPSTWIRLTGNEPKQNGYFQGVNLFSWELAYAYKEKASYLAVINREGRPLGDWTRNPSGTDPLLGPITLTHSRGSWPFVVHRRGSTPANQQPAASAGSDQEVLVGASVTLDGSASRDPDAGPSPLSFAWTQTAGSAVALVGSTNARAGFTAAAAGEFRFRLTVRDGASSASDEVIVRVRASNRQAPYNGTAHAIPGRIQAEHYDTGGEGVAYHDTGAANQGGALRSDGVDLLAITGGTCVSHTADGEWLDYTVDVAEAGSYDLTLRLASASAGTPGVITVSLGDRLVVPATAVPRTGGWTEWEIVTVRGVLLPAGRHVLRLGIPDGGFNCDWIECTPAAAPAFSARVDFRPARAPAVAGWLPDSGAVYGARNGASYGWDAAIGGDARDRQLIPDQLRDTLIHLQKSGSRTWEIAVPPGRYAVHLVCGDPGYTDQINSLDIEGTTVADPDGMDHWDELETEVLVQDGRLTIRPGAGAVNAKLCSLEIMRIVSGGG